MGDSRPPPGSRDSFCRMMWGCMEAQCRVREMIVFTLFTRSVCPLPIQTFVQDSTNINITADWTGKCRWILRDALAHSMSCSCRGRFTSGRDSGPIAGQRQVGA